MDYTGREGSFLDRQPMSNEELAKISGGVDSGFSGMPPITGGMKSGVRCAFCGLMITDPIKHNSVCLGKGVLGGTQA